MFLIIMHHPQILNGMFFHFRIFSQPLNNYFRPSEAASLRMSSAERAERMARWISSAGGSEDSEGAEPEPRRASG